MPFYNDSIFWVELDKITPNPFQPRREFDEGKLKELADSIRQYGILQPLTVTRKEISKEDGGLAVSYELIAGERRLRAAHLAGLSQVPVLIRDGEETDRMKLELAIIENVQREDLNAVDRARAFDRLVKEFGFKHSEIAKKISMSRVYVSNTIRLLGMPEEIQKAVEMGQLSEGHTRPILMLNDRPEQQQVLFKEILYKHLTVREAEAIARRIAFEKVRRKEYMLDPEIVQFEQEFTESLGTRVQIEKKDQGGKIVIDYFSPDDLRSILTLIHSNQAKKPDELLQKFIADKEGESPIPEAPIGPVDDRSSEEKKSDEEDLYSIKNFSI